MKFAVVLRLFSHVSTASRCPRAGGLAESKLDLRRAAGKELLLVEVPRVTTRVRPYQVPTVSGNPEFSEEEAVPVITLFGAEPVLRTFERSQERRKGFLGDVRLPSARCHPFVRSSPAIEREVR